MKPTTNKVIIRADKPKTQTESGLYVPEEKWKTLPPKGTVVSVGPKVTTVKAGDRVIFERYGAVMLEDDLRICLEEHILAKEN